MKNALILFLVLITVSCSKSDMEEMIMDSEFLYSNQGNYFLEDDDSSFLFVFDTVDVKLESCYRDSPDGREKEISTATVEMYKRFMMEEGATILEDTSDRFVITTPSGSRTVLTRQETGITVFSQETGQEDKSAFLEKVDYAALNCF